MTTLSLKEYASSKNFIQIAPTVRTNTNGYPFITMIDKDNKAENVYFSKAAANGVGAGQILTKDLLTSYQIGITTNAAGEERVKLISNSDRISIAELL